MQAVFLKNKSNEIIHSIQESENLEDDIFCVGMYQPIEADYTIKIPQYLRIGKEKSFHIAFVAEEKETIEFLKEQPYSFHCEKRDGRVYFLPDKFDRNVVGESVFLYTKENEIYKITLSILPMMDEQVYEQIKKDLTSVSVRLLYKSKEDEASKRIKKEALSEYDFEIQQLEKSIKELERTLYALNQDPVSDLTWKIDRQSFRKVKRLDANSIMDHYVLQKPKIRVRAHEKTFNIHENQIIYSFLKLLEKRLQELKIEIAEKQETSNQIEQEASKKRSFDQLLQTITKLEKKIQKINQLKIFQKDKFEVHAVYPLKPSNLFVNHKKYRKVFQIMSTYKEVGSLLEQNLTEYNSVHKSSELYEIWCYFKILEILTLEKGYQIDKISWPGKISEPFVFENWHKTDIHKLLRKISNYIEKNEKKDSIKSLEELVIHLVNGEKDIYLGYNCTFKARHTAQSRFQKISNRLRPDIFYFSIRRFSLAVMQSIRIIVNRGWAYKRGIPICLNVRRINIFFV